MSEVCALCKKEFDGEHIFFGERPGRPNLICFKHMAGFILEKFKKMKEQTPNDIITAAAKIIKSDIREIPCDKSEYPSISEISNLEYAKRWVPESILIFLSQLISSELKQVSIGQCIAQASRPRSMIASIPFGVGVYIDKSFATKWLVDHLSKFGFSISSDEVKLFKQSAAESREEEPTGQQHPSFTKWVADNVDHNICTLTGKGTFHGMGIISITSETSRKIQSIKRLKHKTSSVFANAVEIIPYHGSHTHGLLELNFKPFKDLALAKCFAPELNFDLLWQVAWFFASKENPRPNWSGFMQQTTCSNYIYEKATVKFLPIIDLNPSDETCINSTLHFVIKQAEKLGIPTPFITFDQPLWLKATGIIKDQNLNIMCRLGGFHTLMSFLGSIGKLMAGSGLEEVFEEVYAEHHLHHLQSFTLCQEL